MEIMKDTDRLILAPTLANTSLEMGQEGIRVETIESQVELMML